MLKSKLLKLRTRFSAIAILTMLAMVMVPSIAAASQANRVFYTPVASSFMPAGSFGGMIAEGDGKGINKLTINAGPQGYDVYFTINNTNESEKPGTTFFETRKGPGNNDLSGAVALSAVPGQFTNGVNTATLTFNGSLGVPLYVRVHIPPCGSDGTFRIQAHPGGTAKQGNGPGVVAYVKCNGYVPPAPTPTPTPGGGGGTAEPCYDYYGNPYKCP